MENEKNNTQETAMEQVNIEGVKAEVSELETLKAENEELKAKLKSTESSLEFNRKYYMEYMNQRDILKKALVALCESHNISKPEMYAAIIDGNEMDIDSILDKFGKQ